MTPEQNALTQRILGDLQLNNRAIEGTSYAQSIRVMGASALEDVITASNATGEKIAIPSVRSQPLFAFVKEVSTKGEHGYNTMEQTRNAAKYVIETMQIAFACNPTATAHLYKDAYSYLVDTFFLLEKREHFHMPGKKQSAAT